MKRDKKNQGLIESDHTKGKDVHRAQQRITQNWNPTKIWFILENDSSKFCDTARAPKEDGVTIKNPFDPLSVKDDLGNEVDIVEDKEKNTLLDATNKAHTSRMIVP